MSVKPSERLLSLDVFRGITIASMILVNNPGSWSHLFKPLEHAEWHGWTPTDLIFPFFLFIMGVAMAYAFGKHLDNPAAKKALFPKILRRSLMLIGIGLLLNANAFILKIFFIEKYTWADTYLRWLGVLPRIGICYFFASMIILKCKQAGRYSWTFALFFIYMLIFVFIPKSGGDPFCMIKGENIAFAIDKFVLGNHMWQTNNEPEGLLSTLPAIVSVLSGFFTGQWLKTAHSQMTKLAGMMIAGLFLTMQGYLFQEFMPLNKALWTITYVLFSSGMALQFLAVSYFLIDMQKVRSWATPFLAFGSNAIVVFCGSSLVGATLAYARFNFDGKVQSIKGIIYQYGLVEGIGLSPLNGSLAYALGTIAVWGTVAYILYKKKIYVKI